MSPGTFHVISRSRPDSVGGGTPVVAEIFRDLLKPTRSSGGGGGGVEAGIFPAAPRKRKQQSDYLNSGTFFYISDSNNVTTSVHCTKWPPLWLRHCRGTPAVVRFLKVYKLKHGVYSSFCISQCFSCSNTVRALPTEHE